jgi:hypothetical protein
MKILKIAFTFFLCQGILLANEKKYEPGLVPGLIAIVPGSVFHGLGHISAGNSEAGWSHLRVQGYGLLTMVSGIAVVGIAGANRSITPYTVPVIISGAGLFLGPWLTDIYGAFGLGKFASEAGKLDQYWLSAGYANINDAQFPYLANTYLLEAGGWVDHTRLEALVTTSGDSMQAFSLGIDYRFIGRKGDFFNDELSLDLGTAGHYYDYDEDGFITHTQDFRLTWRYPLLNWLESLTGSYLYLQTGIGIQLFGYPVLNKPLGEDLTSILLWKMGFGYDLADTVSGLFYYDHRRDNFVGGLGFKSTGAGSTGYFGTTLRYRLASLLLVEADVAVGSAFVSKIKLSYRGIK